MTTPTLVELERGHWDGWLDRTETWLATTAMLQATFRKLLEDTVPSVHEPNFRRYLSDVLDHAREHEAKVDDLYRAFGRAPGARTKLSVAAGPVVARTREVIGQVEGLAGGARGTAWRSTRQLVLTNLDSMSAFAVAEQLGLAMGNRPAVDIAVAIVLKKSEHGMLLRELFLEMAANSILYGRDM